MGNIEHSTKLLSLAQWCATFEMVGTDIFKEQHY